MKKEADIIKGFYSDLALSDEAINRILSKNNSKFSSSKGRYYALAALLVFALIFTYFSLPKIKTDLSSNIISEIAMNHEKPANMKISTNNFQLLQTKLDRLDFSIQPESKKFLNTYTLQGGSYCSIQGELAVQAKLINNISNEQVTLYVVKMNTLFQNVPDRIIKHHGIWVKIWKENNRLLGLASQSEIDID